GIGAGGNGLDTFAVNGLGENGGGGGSVASDVRSLAGNFADHLCAHVLERVFEFNFFGYGYTVLGDSGRTEFLFDDNVAALGTEGHLHSVGQKVDAAEDRLTGLFSVHDLFCHCFVLLKLSMMFRSYFSVPGLRFW